MHRPSTCKSLKTAIEISGVDGCETPVTIHYCCYAASRGSREGGRGLPLEPDEPAHIEIEWVEGPDGEDIDHLTNDMQDALLDHLIEHEAGEEDYYKELKGDRRLEHKVINAKTIAEATITGTYLANGVDVTSEFDPTPVKADVRFTYRASVNGQNVPQRYSEPYEPPEGPSVDIDSADAKIIKACAADGTPIEPTEDMVDKAVDWFYSDSGVHDEIITKASDDLDAFDDYDA